MGQNRWLNDLIYKWMPEVFVEELKAIKILKGDHLLNNEAVCRKDPEYYVYNF